MRAPTFVICSLVFMVAGAGSAQAGVISYFGDENWVRAHNYGGDGYPANGEQRHWNAALDGLDHGTSASTTDGTTVAGRTNFGVPNADTVVLKLSWDMTRADGGPGTERPYGTNATYHGNAYFTVDEDVSFTIGGFFHNSSDMAEFDVVVREVGTVYGSYYGRYGGVGEFTYVVGVSGYTGPPSGTLLAGRTYLFGSAAGTFGNSSAEANGEVTLTLTRLNPVPEPASLTLFGLGALGLAGGSWRRRKRIHLSQLS